MVKTVIFNLLSRTALSAGLLTLAGGVVLFTQGSAVAQTSGADSLNDVGNSDQRLDSMEGGLNMFEIMHRAQQGGIQNRYDFWQQQQENISEEALDFRNRQRNAIEQQQLDSTQPVAPTSDDLPSQ